MHYKQSPCLFFSYSAKLGLEATKRSTEEQWDQWYQDLPTSRVTSPWAAPEDPSFPNPKSPFSPPLLAVVATFAGGDGGAYPFGAAVGKGGGSRPLFKGVGGRRWRAMGGAAGRGRGLSASTVSVTGVKGDASLANNGGGPQIPLVPSEDRSEASSHRTSWIVVFRKALPVKFIVWSMHEDC
jgi:hypothetical protein